MSNLESNRIRRIVAWSIIGLIAVIGISIVLSLYFAPWRSGGFFHYPFFFPFHFGWLGAILFIFIVFWIARWFFRPWRGGRGGYYWCPQQQQTQQTQDAASIVRERYAKGEITREQFEQMMRDLRQESV